MPFARPTLTGLRDQAVNDITTSGVPGLTGLLRNAVLRVLSWCIAGLAYSVYGYADWIARMGVPFTAADEYLYAWAALIGIYPEPATAATGTATFTGQANTSVMPSGTPLVRQDGTPYITTGNDVVADGSGTIVAPIQAAVVGAYTNADAGTVINVQPAIAGILSAGTTSVLVGGADIETNDSLRTRMLFKYREPPQGGAAADFIGWALEVPGCTRAWVVSEGYGPGSVAVFPMFDDVESANEGFPQGTDGCATDEPRGPTASGEQLLVADHIWTVQPVTCLTYVAAPIPFRINVTLEGLDPNTEDVTSAIVGSLNDLFLVVGEINGVIWPSDLYDAILATPGVNHFEMTEPTVAVQAGPGELPILGTFSAPL